MYAKHMVLVNWGTVPSRTYRLAEITGITGDSGAGKSTMLDALVTLMSAGITQIGRLNMASEDGASHRHKMKSYRRAEEYIVGTAKDGFCRSPHGAHGYIAVSFCPDPEEEGQAAPFTAVMGIAVSKKEGEEPQHQETVFALVVGHDELDHTVFMKESGNKREILAVGECLDALRNQYGIRKGQRKTGVIGFKQEPKKFLRHLWAMFRGREELSQEEADRAALAWCRFVPQEGIEDVSQFVRTLIMPDPRSNADFMGIRKLIRTNQELSRRAKELQQQKAILDEAREACYAHTANYVLARSINLEMLEHEHATRAEERKRLANQNEDSRALIEIKKADQKSANEAAALAHERVLGLTSQLLGKKGYKEHEALREEVAGERLALRAERSKAERLVAGLHQVGQHVAVLELAAQAKPLGALAALVKDALFQAGLYSRLRLSELDYVQGLPETPGEREWKELAAAAKPLEVPFQKARVRLCGETRELLALGRRETENVERLQRELGNKLSALQGELADIEKRQFLAPPPWAAETKSYIERALPEANPVFLYELVKDVRDPDWQVAIEGKLNLARFNIFVDQKYERAVDVLLRKRPKGSRTAPLIQGSLAIRDAQAKVVPDSSIVSEIIVEHPGARAYLINQFGAERKEKDGADMTQVHRGVRKDGRAAGGYTTFNADERIQGKLYFGSRALELRKTQLSEEIPQVERSLKDLGDVLSLLRKLDAADRALASMELDTLQMCAGRALALVQSIAAKEAELAAMDITEFKLLEEERDRAKAEQARYVEQAQKLGEEIENEKTQISKRLDRMNAIDLEVDSLAGKVADARNEVARLVARVSWVSPSWLEERAASLAESGKSRIEQMASLGQPVRAAVTRILQAMWKFNEAVGEEGPISVSELGVLDPVSEAAFEVMATKYAEVDARIRSIAADQLSGSSTELAQHEAVMRSRFTEYFCDKLLAELTNAKAVLHQLNSDLRHHVFGSERFEFEPLDASPQYAARRAFFEYVREQTGKDERFNPFEDEISEEMGAVRDEIVRLLSSEEERDQRTLEQIADYRNYHFYEMYKVFQHEGDEKPTRIAMSTHGKDSGGEKENGILIARAATISSALALRKPGPHLRFVAIDELMKKTGEARIRESVDFISERLGLQVLFVMPTRAIGPFKDLADLEYNIARVATAIGEGTLRDKVHVDEHWHDRDVVKSMREERAAEIRAKAIVAFEAEESRAAVQAKVNEQAA